MLQKTWFKLFIWGMTVFFFFLASAVIISILKPGPSQTDVMRFMQGMMEAMESSLMGISMAVENDSILSQRILFFTGLTIPLIIIGAISGLIVRVLRKENKHV